MTPRKSNPAKRGPKPQYDPTRHPVIVRNAARAGLTMPEIATEAGISSSQLYVWNGRYPEITEALKEGRDYADGKVVDSLYRRALGYEYDETEVTKGPKGSTAKKSRKQVPPDVVACIFWLKNRRPDLWRDKQNVEHTGKDGQPIKTETSVEITTNLEKCGREFEEFARRQMGDGVLSPDRN